MATICPLISDAQCIIPCQESCALFMDGKCAIFKIAQSLPDSGSFEPDSNVLDSDGNI